MKRISNPLADETMETIYSTLVNSYSQAEKRKIGEKYKIEVVEYAKEYERKMTTDFSSLSLYSVEENEAKYLIGLYDNRMVSLRIGGYYDKIKKGARGICPYCGCGSAHTVDHFLPKSEYPLLAITPQNLVPSCRECNENKLKYNPRTLEELIIHPYFDYIGEQWLKAEFTFYQDETYEITFGVNSPLSNSCIEHRLITHFEVCGLQDTFQSHAKMVLDSTRKNLKDLAGNAGKDILMKHLKDEYTSACDNDINTWYSAMFNALCEQVDELFDWLIQ